MLEAALEKLDSCTHTGVKEVLRHSIMLYALSLVKKHIDWYLMNGVVSAEAAEELDAAQ